MNGVADGHRRSRAALIFGWICIASWATSSVAATDAIAPASSVSADATAPAATAPANSAAAADTVQPHVRGITPADVRLNPPVPHLLTPHDLWFLGATIAGTAIAVTNDQWLTNEAIEAEGHAGLRSLARSSEPLGNPTYLLPLSLGLYGAARWIDHPQLARRSARVGLAVVVAGIVTTGLKEVVGRERPYESPGQSNSFKPFSGHNSFPSGHSATAFAAAVALDRETTGHWVPYLVYPAASLVAWSRVHDEKHWTSDVVAGAAIGGWTAWKVETFLAHRALGVAPEGKKTSLLLVPRDGTMQLVMVHNF